MGQTPTLVCMTGFSAPPRPSLTARRNTWELPGLLSGRSSTCSRATNCSTPQSFNCQCTSFAVALRNRSSR